MVLLVSYMYFSLKKVDSSQYGYCKVAVVEFLYSLYYSGLSFSVTNMARFSLSTIKPYLLIICVPVGNCPLVQRTLQGNFELQPPSPN